MRLFFDGERGSALVITVLVCLAMTGLALVAVSSASLENQVVQNQKMLKQAHYVAETGLMVTMQLVQNIGADSLLKEKQQLDREAPGKKINFNLRSFGKDTVYVTQRDDPTGNTFGLQQVEMDFQVEVWSIQTVGDAVGYQLNRDQQGAGLEVSLIAQGRVGRLESAQQASQRTDTAFSEKRAWALVPVQ